MTGGRVVVIGRTGRNFAAGMSGGVAYVLDRAGDFPRRCNLGMVELEPLVHGRGRSGSPGPPAAARPLHGQRRRRRASSPTGPAAQPRFVKVMPRDYKRALAAMRRAREEGIPWERAVMEGAHG